MTGTPSPASTPGWKPAAWFEDAPSRGWYQGGGAANDDEDVPRGGAVDPEYLPEADGTEKGSVVAVVVTPVPMALWCWWWTTVSGAVSGMGMTPLTALRMGLEGPGDCIPKPRALYWLCTSCVTRAESRETFSNHFWSGSMAAWWHGSNRGREPFYLPAP